MPDKNSFWDGKRPKEEVFANKSDVDNLSEKIDKLVKQQEEQRQGTGKFSNAKKVLGSVKKGLGDVVDSLNSNENSKRMRISQMPGKKAPIATYNHSNPLSGKDAGIKRKRISNAPVRED